MFTTWTMQSNSVALPVLSDLQKVCNYFFSFLYITNNRIFLFCIFRFFQVRRFLSTVLPIVRLFQKVTTMKNVFWEPVRIYLAATNPLQDFPLFWSSVCRLCLLHQCYSAICVAYCIFYMVLDKTKLEEINSC